MRHFLLVPLLATPATAAAIAPDDARHLLARTGFEARAEAVAQLAQLAHDAAVRKLLDGVRREPLTPAPSWVNDAPPERQRLRKLDETARQQLQQRLREQAIELKGWWYREMLATDSPLTERMTLFWHNHFTSSLRKVKWPPALYRQNLLLRRHALGNFGELLHAIARDPGMLVYLDGRQNRREKPNENFARELLELFTLGEGHYGEHDIKEAARAFTGWTLNRNAEFVVNPRQHDDGVKVFLGRRGNLDGDAIIDIVLQQPRTAEYITEKLWREFISDTPDTAEVKRLAAILRSSYEIRPLMQALLDSAAFRDPGHRGVLVKSPVELLVGTLRQFRIPVTEERLLVRAGRFLGQDIFDPPNVKGWPGGRTWISSSTLMLRQQALERMLRGTEMGAMPEAMMTAADADAAALTQLLLPLDPVDTPGDARGMALVRALVLDPTYQLK